MNADLPPAAVPAAVYDERYYLNACLGYEEWRESGGARMAGLYPGVLARAGLRAGEQLVDVGAGRGELVVAAAELGAGAIGIEYSAAAVELSRRTLAAHGDPPGARMLLADARALPLPDGQADLVTMLDVIEHLTVGEQATVLREARRVMAPGGRILIHTLPNRLIYDVTYRFQRLLSRRRRRRWPGDPRNDYERLMHVGEQSAFSLWRALRAAGFANVRVTHGEMVYVDFVPDERARVTYARLAAHRLTAPLGRADLWGEARAAAG
jgi:ubiquinone/menaquinone biosynthesis C-methylase UbiE